MSESDLDPNVKNTLILIFGAIVYIIIITFSFKFFGPSNSALIYIFALALLPLIAILVIVWGYGLRLKMPGIELEYYPVERVMKPALSIKEDMTGKEAEEIMEKENVDFLNIIDKKGLFAGILTNTDVYNALSKGKLRDKVKNLMTLKDDVISALEWDDLKCIMEKIGESKHSRLPVLDKNNRVMGIVDAVDINKLLAKILI